MTAAAHRDRTMARVCAWPVPSASSRQRPHQRLRPPALPHHHLGDSHHRTRPHGARHGRLRSCNLSQMQWRTYSMPVGAAAMPSAFSPFFLLVFLAATYSGSWVLMWRARSPARANALLESETRQHSDRTHVGHLCGFSPGWRGVVCAITSFFGVAAVGVGSMWSRMSWAKASSNVSKNCTSRHGEMNKPTTSRWTSTI